MSAVPQESTGSQQKTTRRNEENERKSSLHVASLNMNGYGNLVRDHPDNKWGKVYRMMTEHRIGVLLLQETHLTEERKASLHKMFARKLKIFYSANPNAPTQREGVAIVLNSRHVNTMGATETVLIPGRAIQVSLRCQGGDIRHILCIYAPTSDGVGERICFFEEVCKYYDDRPNMPRPHLMAGDFNNVEDAIDRLPVHSEPDQSVHALDDLKISLGMLLADGWRLTNPTRRDYTFHRGTAHDAVFSRLDRFYVTPAVFEGARDWRICEAGVRTDHSLIMVQLTSENAPAVGPGRPVFPLQLLREKKLAKQIKQRGLRAISELAHLQTTNQRSDEQNPQIILHHFKTDVMKLARRREKEVVPRLLADIRERERALAKVKAQRDISEDTRVAEAAALTRQIRQLKQQRVKQQQQNSRATHRLYGDRPTKYWSKLHRECAPRDIISAFEKEGLTGPAGEKLYETDSKKMAMIARTHHMNVQRDAPDSKPPDERERDILAALDSLDVEISGSQAEGLGGTLTYGECELSLRVAKNGTSPGIDGVPFELWKALHARHVEDCRFPERPDFDVVRLLTAAFEDARLHGVSTRTSFAQGWIAPIYKEKGERTHVVNYRPITLLNTDYKLLSKALAVRLASVAPELIHRAQAGFVPGRRIQDHTQLARMMMHWADENDEDGAIVALDQEKAYDKIAHDYLWRVLQKLKIPPPFIQLVQSLYAGAETAIMINGFLSKSYRIYRGVRQGDPLSCLLFDFAIEPLSAMIRKSDINGFNLPRCNETLKSVLFADDTTVYLSSRDDFAVLQGVLDRWCSAAKARFNMSKTEIIPIGSQTHRDEMATTYCATGAWKNYPKGVHVAQDGEAVRILGAFFGNGVSQTDVWTLVLTKIVAMKKPLMHAIERWKTGHASLQGKKYVIQMIVRGMTQFFTTVQRMPEAILIRLTRLIRSFLWDDRHNTPVGMEHVCLPTELGGLGLLDLQARSDAIDVMWLKSYLDFSSERPLWACIADDLLAGHVPKACRLKKNELRVNPFLQGWKPKVYGLPAELDGMMRVARKYGVRLEGLAFSRSILNAMPIWDHSEADSRRQGRLMIASKLLTCMQEQHGIRTVGDCARLAVIMDDPAHISGRNCKCTGCKLAKELAGCGHPHLCATRAKELMCSLPDKWNPTKRQPEDYERGVMDDLRKEELSSDLTPFDRCITTHGDVGHAIRIFTDGAPVSNETIPMDVCEVGTSLFLATDGSCLRNGEKDAQAGAGVYAGPEHELNRSLRLPDTLEQSNQTGEIVATLTATTITHNRIRLIQETDSRTTMDSLTKWIHNHEDTGYILQRNAELTRLTIARLRMRRAHTIFKWVKGHNGHAGNEAADELAAKGAGKLTGDGIDLEIPRAFMVSGAKLRSMTQRLAYRAIRSRRDEKTDPRPSAVSNMDRIASGIQAAFGVQLHDATIWASFKSKHVTRSAAQFLWMAVHNGYMIGSHWLRPNMSEDLQRRAICGICGERESMTHIILECGAVGQELIWDLLKEVWRHTKAPWKEPSWGTILGAANAVFRTTGGSRSLATENLWCILATEAVHLVWKLRCERVIQKDGEDFSVQEVTNRFYSTLDSRLNLDRRTAARARGKRALKPQDVDRIWRPILENKDNLPSKWVIDCGVLVGIKRGK